jgi:hypothetical protein
LPGPSGVGPPRRWPGIATGLEGRPLPSAPD